MNPTINFPVGSCSLHAVTPSASMSYQREPEKKKNLQKTLHTSNTKNPSHIKSSPFCHQHRGDSAPRGTQQDRSGTATPTRDPRAGRAVPKLPPGKAQKRSPRMGTCNFPATHGLGEAACGHQGGTLGTLLARQDIIIQQLPVSGTGGASWGHK